MVFRNRSIMSRHRSIWLVLLFSLLFMVLRKNLRIPPLASSLWISFRAYIRSSASFTISSIDLTAALPLAVPQAMYRGISMSSELAEETISLNRRSIPEPSFWGITTANSSPPIRATVSCSPAISRRISFALSISLSPHLWPMPSFMSLRPLTSHMTTVTGSMCPLPSSLMVSSKNRRLCRPVRESRMPCSLISSMEARTCSLRYSIASAISLSSLGRGENTELSIGE